MFYHFIPLICGIIGLVIGIILGFAFTLFMIATGTANKREERIKYRMEMEKETPSLAERMNNQDFALSHQPGNAQIAIAEKQKNEDSAYQFLKRNRKE